MRRAIPLLAPIFWFSWPTISAGGIPASTAIRRWGRPTSTGSPVPDSVRILPSYLQELGYFTGMMAKSHLGPNGDRQFQWYSPKLSQVFPTFLDSAGTRPFFLWVGFHWPHRPYQRSGVPHPHSPSQVKVTPY